MTETIRFTGQWPPLAVAMLALVAAAAVVAWYARESRSLASPYHVLLPALRGAAVAMAILTLAGPVWHRREVIGTLGRVIFAVDTSASMSLTDSSDDASDASRLQRASRLLAGDSAQAGWLEALARSHVVDVIAFDGEAARTVWTSRSSAETPTLGELSADGLTTDLALPLRSILPDSDSNVPPAGDAPPGEVGTGNAGDTESAAGGAIGSTASGDGERATRTAMVLMSDGRDTSGSSASDIAAELSARAVTVHAIGMGNDHEPADLGVLDVTAPESVASDGRLAGGIVVKQQGRVGETLRLRIESSEQTVWQESVQVQSDGQRSVPFTIPVAPILQRIREASSDRVRRNTVVMDLSAVVEPIAGDLTTDNDRFPFRVAATTRQRRLLVLEGSSRWELRYLRKPVRPRSAVAGRYDFVRPRDGYRGTGARQRAGPVPRHA